MVGGEEGGRWCSMICLGFEDSSELTPSPLSPHWPVLGPLSGKWGNIMDQKTVLSLTLLQSVSLRYMAPSRNGLTGRGNGRLDSAGEKRGEGRWKGDVCIALVDSGVVVVLGNNETSVTGIKDFPDPTGLKARGSSVFSD